MGGNAEGRYKENNRGGTSGLASNDQDRLLVERARQGDTEAMGVLLEQHRKKARGWAERLTRDSYMADDVVQDALIRVGLPPENLGLYDICGRTLYV
ncbi:sigma factor [Paenibacillus sp. M1]|uniref:Sigma factor n=1 Tax=Paenibacillus haidiansis TaxID=1574488 RepID=A0ABU7VRV9_9BACL